MPSKLRATHNYEPRYATQQDWSRGHATHQEDKWPADDTFMAQPDMAEPSVQRILRLQQTIGNQATLRRIGRAHGQRSANIQRNIENRHFGDSVSEDDKLKANAFFDAFNNAVKDAHKFAISVPSLGAYVKLNGYTELWGTKWTQYLAKQRPKLMAATFGYVIESLVSEATGPFRPSAPSGCSIYTQVTSGGTRPDVVLRLKKGTSDIAWLDLTASGSVDHIFDKEGWDSKVEIFAEVSYPSLTPGDLALMVTNKDNTSTLSNEEFKKKQEEAQKLYAARKDHWLKQGRDNYAWGILKSDYAQFFKEKYHIKLTRDTASLFPKPKQEFIHKTITEDFETATELKMIPSILQAMGVNPTTWGFDIGFSQSERAGEAWLVDNDPDAPSTVGV